MSYDNSPYGGAGSSYGEVDSPYGRADTSYGGAEAYHEQSRFSAEPVLTDDRPAHEDDFGAEGYRDEGLPAAGTGYSPAQYREADDPSAPGSAPARGHTAADLVNRPGRPDQGRDRLWIHFVWESILLLAVAATAYQLHRAHPAALRGARLHGLEIYIAALGFVAVGMSLSLRAAVPNVALGSIGAVSAFFFAQNSDRGIVPTAGVTVLLALAVGLALALVVTLLNVPSWAASLGAAFVLIGWLDLHHGAAHVVASGFRPAKQSLIWLGLFLFISLLGGAIAMRSGPRRVLGRFRPSADPARRRSGVLVVVFALLASSASASVGGMLIALNDRQVSPTDNGLALTALALGAALVGGTSAFGRRGGFAGTALAVIGLGLIVWYVDAQGKVVNNFALGASAVGIGLVISRLVEFFGRPKG